MNLDEILHVHHRDNKSGRIESSRPYILHCEGGERFFEIDGLFYKENGEEYKNPPRKATKMAKEILPSSTVKATKVAEEK